MQHIHKRMMQICFFNWHENRAMSMDPVNVLSLYYLEMIEGYRMAGNNVTPFDKKKGSIHVFYSTSKC